MPAPIVMIFVAGALLGVAVLFWQQICDWYAEHTKPWLLRHLPSLASSIHEAFKALDNVAVAVRTAIRAAWQRVRPHILQAVIEFRRLHDGEWVRRIESFLTDAGGQVCKVTEEQVMAWDELPDSVREAALERRRAAPVDFVQSRDREVFTMQQGA
jgi:hypothetical protein